MCRKAKKLFEDFDAERAKKLIIPYVFDIIMAAEPDMVARKGIAFLTGNTSYLLQT